MAGIVFKNRYIKSTSQQKFSGFLEYQNREEAVNEKAYSAFQDYMLNTEKTGNKGSFDFFNDKLSDYQLNYYKQKFDEAKEKGSNLWQSVLTFEDAFLIGANLLNEETRELDYEKFQHLAKKSMTKLLDVSDFDLKNVMWTGAVHFNTEHIHVHFAMVEKEPNNWEGKKRPVTVENFETMKSEFVKGAYGEKFSEMYKSISEKRNTASFLVSEDKQLLLLDKYAKKLPSGKLSMGLKKMTRFRSEMKDVVESIIQHSPELKKVVDQYDKEVDDAALKQEEVYGKREESKTYAKNKKEDLRVRLANQFLQNVSDYRNENAIYLAKEKTAIDLPISVNDKKKLLKETIKKNKQKKKKKNQHFRKSLFPQGDIIFQMEMNTLKAIAQYNQEMGYTI